MVTNILVSAIDFLLASGDFKEPGRSGHFTETGIVFDKEAEIKTTYVKGSGFIEGTVGETNFLATYDESINRHSFKLSVDGKQPFIVDKEELLLIARDHF